MMVGVCVVFIVTLRPVTASDTTVYNSALGELIQNHDFTCMYIIKLTSSDYSSLFKFTAGQALYS